MPRANPPQRLQRAAELRARGYSWEAVARELNCTVKTLQGWIRKFPRPWSVALRKHERAIVREVKAESLLTLRKLLRSEDEKTAREAAAVLIRFATTQSKSATKKSPSPASPSPEIAAIAEFVGGLDDEEATILLRELRAASDDPGTVATPAPPPEALAE